MGDLTLEQLNIAQALFVNRPSGIVQSALRVRLLQPPSFSVENGPSSGLTTFDGGSTTQIVSG